MCTSSDSHRKMKDAKDLVFSDDFMFGAIMQDKEVCREVLECILNVKIARLEFPKRQKAIDLFYEIRGVRLDIYVEGDDKVYEVEMQNADKGNLDERTWFYLSMIDMDYMEKGDDFSDVKDCVIIFLCRYDPYKEGLPCYTFSMKCDESTSVKSNYKVTQKIYNCTAYGKAENGSLRAFMEYVQKNRTKSDFTRRLSNMVEAKKEQQEFLSAYYVYRLHQNDAKKEGRAEGIEEGKKQGIEQNKLESAMNLLRMKVISNEQIAQAVGLPLETIEKLSGQI